MSDLFPPDLSSPSTYSPASLTPPTGPVCRFCLSTPAAKATFRRHRGMIILMQWASVKGPFCRDCGMAAYRKMTSDTMVQGWWGWISFFITPFILLWNLIVSFKVRGLPVPVPSPVEPRHPMNPGRPLWQRWTIVGLAVPLAALGLAVASSAGDGASADQCVRFSGQERATFVSCSGTHDGRVIKETDDPADCPAEADSYVQRGSSSSTTPVVGAKTYCIDETTV